jgi:glycosyltransferase involved in cell wall biosynthesis
VPFVLNVQDLFPQSVIDLGILRNRWLIRFFEHMERFIYRQADHITVHSPGNRDHVVGKGAPSGCVTVMPNWVDTEFICPGERRNGFFEQYNLDGKFVVSFAGILGYSQDLDIVLEAAKLLQRYPDIRFLIVGDGVEKPRLERKAVEMGLENVRFIPMQPRRRYPEVLNASDVCLATLHTEVRTPVVPSKILSIMAAARPVVAAMNPDGDAPGLIEEAQCGLAVPPEDPKALADAILSLYNDKALRVRLGQNGRRYAEEHLSLKVASKRYIEIFKQVLETQEVKQ